MASYFIHQNNFKFNLRFETVVKLQVVDVVFLMTFITMSHLLSLTIEQTMYSTLWSLHPLHTILQFLSCIGARGRAAPLVSNHFPRL